MINSQRCNRALTVDWDRIFTVSCRMGRWLSGLGPLAMAAVTMLFLLLYCGEAAQAASATEIQQWLNAHNTYRTLHGVSDVTWSETVADEAQDWADSCPAGHSGSSYGENMAFATGFYTIQSIVDGWYSEEPNYDYSNPGYYENPNTGHFTQVVWSATTEIGCGYTTGCQDIFPGSPGTWSDVWVCNYSPAGNVLTQFASNVFPPETFLCPDCSGGTVNLTDIAFPATTCECIATTAINIISNVTIPANATVTFQAPLITVKPIFEVKSGATVYMKQ